MALSTIKKFVLAGCIALLPAAISLAQRKVAPVKKIPMKAEHWTVHSGKASFEKYKNVDAIRLEAGGLVILKDLDFTNGTFEFDAEPLDAQDSPFVTSYFRFQDRGESEVFYLRVGREDSHKRNDAVQYSPVIKHVNLWDLLPQYQGPSRLYNNDWNHIKIVVNGKQMRAYVNDMDRAALEISCLEGSVSHGTLALEGLAAFANLVIRPDVVEDLPATMGPDLTNHDANYIRKWLVTQPVELANGRELSQAELPGDQVTWEMIEAERNGLVNLTRKFGTEERRYVWVKTTIKSTAELKKRVQLGFSDEVWVFVNGRMTYVDKNLYLQGMRKPPNGRCSIENASFDISLTPGDNEIMIGVANDFYGWGIIARIDNLDGIELLP
ncbi:MAG TPA: hypothetical protein VFZ52_12005 [Chryseolinea sp.]